MIIVDLNILKKTNTTLHKNKNINEPSKWLVSNNFYLVISCQNV